MKRLISFLICMICLFGCNKNNVKFELCPGKKHPYYYPNLRYNGDFYEIKAHYYNNYRTISLPNNTGVVKIMFSVNCKGKSGNYFLETYSLNYNNIIINKKITEQLINLTKTLNDWIPALDEDGESVNSHKFFAFKIIDGKLTDILPK